MARAPRRARTPWPRPAPPRRDGADPSPRRRGTPRRRPTAPRAARRCGRAGRRLRGSGATTKQVSRAPEQRVWRRLERHHRGALLRRRSRRAARGPRPRRPRASIVGRRAPQELPHDARLQRPERALPSAFPDRADALPRRRLDPSSSLCDEAASRGALGHAPPERRLARRRMTPAEGDVTQPIKRFEVLQGCFRYAFTLPRGSRSEVARLELRAARRPA